MTFNPGRALIFGAVALPVGFILTAFMFAATEREIAAPTIIPWAIAIAVAVAVVGGLTTPKDRDDA